MNAAQIVHESEVGSSQLAAALVATVHADATVSVTTLEDGTRVSCDVLRSADTSTLTLVEGDTVLIWRRLEHRDRGVILGRIGPSQAQPAEVKEQPDELVIEAKKNLTLKCGDGSITIREDGKILIKGKDLVSHAQRMNRIKGGSVSIN
jgi:hypothetical protein